MKKVVILMTAAALLTALVALTAGRAGATPTPQGPVLTHAVAPTATDPGLTGPSNPNLAVVGPAAGRNGLLVVFLPGSGGQPGCCQLFLTEAARLGFHAVGLTYNNTTAVGSRCENDLTCYATVRRNVFDGADPSPYSALPPRDGVDHRLAALLAYLARTYPAEGWGRFLAAGQPDYALTLMTGHSQGGGEAAFIATLRRVRGVVTLSSPPDTNSAHEPAPWLYTVRSGGATANTRYYAFVHTADPFYARITADWTAMGLDGMGGRIDVDAVGAPYRGAHELFSSAPVPDVTLATHDATAVDSAQPLCPDGASEYTLVWRYLLQSAADLPVTTTAPGCAGA